MRSERLGDLHCERPNAAGCPVDQDPLPGLHLSLIANGSQRGERRVSDRRRLLEGEVGWLGEEIARRSMRIFREGALAPAEYLVARPELLDVCADRLDLSGDISSPGISRLGRRSPATKRTT